MNFDEFAHRQHQFSVIAEMNQRYHQAASYWWSFGDKACRIAVGVVAVADVVVASIAAYSDQPPFSHAIPIVAAGAAVLLAVALNVIPLVERSMIHSDLFREWSHFREDVEELKFDAIGGITDQVIERLRRIESRLHRICATEPKPNKKMLLKCQQDAERWRQCETYVRDRGDGNQQAGATAC